MQLSQEYKIKEKGKLLQLIGTALDAVASTRLYAKEWSLLNTQEYLDFEDTLNKFSTMDPNN